jgi:hypothetical protein
MDATQDLSSMGFICQTLQRSPGAIRKAIEAMGITPTVIINGRAHYSDEDVEAIREHLKREGQR